MSTLNANIKCVYVSGCILWNKLDLIIKNVVTYSNP